MIFDIQHTFCSFTQNQDIPCITGITGFMYVWSFCNIETSDIENFYAKCIFATKIIEYKHKNNINN